MILSGLGIVYVKEISLILVEIPRIHRLFSLLCTYGLNYLQKLWKWVIVLWTMWKLPWILHAWIIVFYEGLSEWQLLRHRLLFLKSCTKYCCIYLLYFFCFAFVCQSTQNPLQVRSCYLLQHEMVKSQVSLDTLFTFWYCFMNYSSETSWTLG